MAGIVNKFIGHVMPGVIRPLKVLWNEVIGFLFLVFAVFAASSAFRSIRQLDTPCRQPLPRKFVGFLHPINGLLRHHIFSTARKISRS